MAFASVMNDRFALLDDEIHYQIRGMESLLVARLNNVIDKRALPILPRAND